MLSTDIEKSAKRKVKQQYNKHYVDPRRHDKSSDIKVGDRILVQHAGQNKLTSRFSTILYTVITKRWLRVTAQNRNYHIKGRNVSEFQRIPQQNSADSGTSRPSR